jgi:hypothetical protein
MGGGYFELCFRGSRAGEVANKIFNKKTMFGKQSNIVYTEIFGFHVAGGFKILYSHTHGVRWDCWNRDCVCEPISECQFYCGDWAVNGSRKIIALRQRCRGFKVVRVRSDDPLFDHKIQ